MLQKLTLPRFDISDSASATAVDVLGAGVAGTWQALLLARAGCKVTLYERDTEAMTQGTSHYAGGMLAPWCESEVGEPLVTRLGLRSLALWRNHVPGAAFNGSLVIAHARDRADFSRFARLTSHYERLDAEGVGALEPALAGRFSEGLFYPDEGHVEPRKVLPELRAQLAALGVEIRFGTTHTPEAADGDRIVIDCRGLGARDTVSGLRGVKGEMILIETDEVELARPVRLIHPRWPLYLIPRDKHCFMLGATSIESEDDRVSVRSALELLSAAYTVHPAFGEARILDFGAGLRPAFADNLPQIEIRGRTITVNGLYRHGFLIAPALAEATVTLLTRGEIDNEVMRCS